MYEAWELRPEDVEPELAAELAIAPEPYDSVIVLWDSGAVPTNYWGLAYVGPIGWGAYQFTWSTVIRGQDWYWSRNDAPGEVILHEWLHGLEGHYRNYGYVVPDLHGAEEHGYKEDAVGGWRTWLRDYMQGRVVKDGWTRGISPGVWGSGAVNNLVRPAPIQLLAPLSGTQTAGSPTLIWAGPGQSFRARLTNTADLSPAYEAYTAASQMVPSSIPLHPNSQYRWQVVSRSGATESPAPEWKYFRYAGPGVP
jgi:hypothetical protein